MTCTKPISTMAVAPVSTIACDVAIVTLLRCLCVGAPNSVCAVAAIARCWTGWIDVAAVPFPWVRISIVVLDATIVMLSSTSVGLSNIWVIRGCHMVDNGAYFNGLPMSLRLDHIQTCYVDYLRTYFSKRMYLCWGNGRQLTCHRPSPLENTPEAYPQALRPSGWRPRSGRPESKIAL